MERSFSQSVELECTACQAPFGAEVWLIVDAAERPDLSARIVDGTLHVVRCPRCGAAYPLDAPVLYHDAAAERLIFAAQEQSSPEQDQQVAQQLGQHLIAALPLNERGLYLTTAHTLIGLEQLQQVLAGDEDIETDELSDGLKALMEAGTPAEVRAAVEQHPVLATPEAHEYLGEYVRRLRIADQPELAAALEQRIGALAAGEPHPTLQFIQALIDAPTPEERRALLISRPQDVSPEVPTILEALADQAQRRHLEPVARDLLVIRDEVLASLGRTAPLTPSA